MTVDFSSSTAADLEIFFFGVWRLVFWCLAFCDRCCGPGPSGCVVRGPVLGVQGLTFVCFGGRARCLCGSGPRLLRLPAEASNVDISHGAAAQARREQAVIPIPALSSCCVHIQTLSSGIFGGLCARRAGLCFRGADEAGKNSTA